MVTVLQKTAADTEVQGPKENGGLMPTAGPYIKLQETKLSLE